MHGDIRTKAESWIEMTVEDEVELMLRMGRHHVPEHLVGEPADAFELAGHQEAGIDGYHHFGR